jgi:hypothetical protein
MNITQKAVLDSMVETAFGKEGNGTISRAMMRDMLTIAFEYGVDCERAWHRISDHFDPWPNHT